MIPGEIKMKKPIKEEEKKDSCMFCNIVFNDSAKKHICRVEKDKYYTIDLEKKSGYTFNADSLREAHLIVFNPNYRRIPSIDDL